MNRIEIQYQTLLYYGNPVGTIGEDGKTAVLEIAFRCAELEQFLLDRKIDHQWSPGVFDRLASGSQTEDIPIRACRIWQLRPDVLVDKKFIAFSDLLQRFGQPDPKDYAVVYDGRIASNNLDEIYSQFDLSPPAGFTGRRISMSDVIELYDHHNRIFYYVDRLGFQPIPFQSERTES